MPVSIIAALAANRVIGNRGALPWRLSDDLARFRRLTLGHAVVMGRTTYTSMGRPLSGRRNIVLSHDPALRIPGCEVAASPELAIAAAGAGEVFIIGGASVYAHFLPLADRMYLTHIDVDIPGDTLFPEVSWDEWRILREIAPPRENAHLPAHRFVDYERKPG
jgi:dihydrofolate reductase